MRKNDELTYASAAALAVWLLIITAGWIMLSRYENTPGKVEAAAAHWPVDSRIHRSLGLPTLIMFVHPRCPCSRATLGELALVMAHCPKKARTQVLFVKPPGVSVDWVKTDLWRTAAAIPGVEVAIDDKGREAEIFHAGTSGQVFLYDAYGNLVFSGGITSSRGHSGDNAGRSAIEDFLNTGKVPLKHTPFFGCLLFNSKPSAPQGGR